MVSVLVCIEFNDYSVDDITQSSIIDGHLIDGYDGGDEVIDMMMVVLIMIMMVGVINAVRTTHLLLIELMVMIF